LGKTDIKISPLGLGTVKIGRKAEECLFIDDSEANIKVANQLGFKTICYLSPEQLENELQRLGLL
jgi:FMN phosphatase YigB (HAD superfamily)